MASILTPLTINRRTIVQNILTLLSGTVIAQVITSLMLLLTARTLGPSAYGEYASSLAMATTLSIFYSLGLNVWLLREGGRQPELVGNFLGNTLLIKTSLGLLSLGVIYLLLPVITSRSQTLNLIFLAAIAVFLNNLFLTIQTAYKSILQNRINATFEVVSALVLLILTLILISRSDQEPGTYIVIRCIVFFLSLVSALGLSRSMLQLSTDKPGIRQALGQSPPFAASELLAILFLRVDLLIIALRLDTYSAGIYSTAEGLVNGLFIVPNTVTLVVLPVLSNLFSKDPTKAWNTAKRSLYLLSVIGAGLFLATLAVSEIVPLFLGEEYQGSKEILRILSVILFLHSLSFGFAAILVATNQQAKRAWVQFIAVTVNIALNLFVIDRWGITGTAYVYIITEVFLLAGYSGLVIRYRKRHPPSFASAN